MDISGIMPSYDSRATTSAALSRTLLAPHYISAHSFSGPSSTTLVTSHHQMQQQHNPFTFGAYTSAHSSGMIPAFANNYVQQRPLPLPRMIQAEVDTGRLMGYERNTRQGYIEEHHSQSPPIKSESLWNVPTNSPTFANANANAKIITSSAPVNGSAEVVFGTEVDTLMKAIQAKSKTAPAQTSTSNEANRPLAGASRTPPYIQATSQGAGFAAGEPSKFKLSNAEQNDDSNAPKAGKKRYSCTIENCTKSFYQKTHLDIHERAHTGVKPYPCKEPGCGRSFSQLGNLKTHERRHTGERPYQCEICGKRFAQRGNVRAHKIVHDQSKPYLCRLDECGKMFTQLGNLKSHQNKFHIATIRSLTAKFASIEDGDIVHAGDKELWEYFANLYKNSNKGIKGRGKDRKVGSNSNAMNLSSGMRNNGVNSRGASGFGMNGSGRGNMVVGMMNNGGGMSSHHHGHSHGHNHPQRGEGAQYEMFDVDDRSQSGSHSVSSVGTCYDDAPSDSFEDTHHRSGDLAFGDRIY